MQSRVPFIVPGNPKTMLAALRDAVAFRNYRE